MDVVVVPSGGNFRGKSLGITAKIQEKAKNRDFGVYPKKKEYGFCGGDRGGLGVGNGVVNVWGGQGGLFGIDGM
jgi:hypothetical protein